MSSTNSKSSEKDGALTVRKEDVPAGLHDRIEVFVAKERLKGRTLKKPQAIVTLLQRALSITEKV